MVAQPLTTIDAGPGDARDNPAFPQQAKSSAECYALGGGASARPENARLCPGRAWFTCADMCKLTGLACVTVNAYRDKAPDGRASAIAADGAALP